MAEQVSLHVLSFVSGSRTNTLSRSPFRVRLKLFNSSNRPCTSNSWRPTKSSLSRPLA
jgi:hypothetical protein